MIEQLDKDIQIETKHKRECEGCKKTLEEGIPSFATWAREEASHYCIDCVKFALEQMKGLIKQ